MAKTVMNGTRKNAFTFSVDIAQKAIDASLLIPNPNQLIAQMQVQATTIIINKLHNNHNHTTTIDRNKEEAQQAEKEKAEKDEQEVKKEETEKDAVKKDATVKEATKGRSKKHAAEKDEIGKDEMDNHRIIKTAVIRSIVPLHAWQ